MSCGTGHRHSPDPALLWLWHRLAAVAPIQLAWELPYAVGAVLKSKKKEQTNKRKKIIAIGNESFEFHEYYIYQYKVPTINFFFFKAAPRVY